MNPWKTHVSELDRSVNFVRATADGGAIECRYVRRDEDYLIAYVSSHSGCRLACRFCHLTQSGSTMFTPETADGIADQVATVLAWHDARETPARRMHVNFMSRGDLLANPGAVREFGAFAGRVACMARDRALRLRLNISSIFPRGSDEIDLVTAFGGHPVTFFWSLYSLSGNFRRRWMPNADAPTRTLARLRRWQEENGGEVVLHWALIEDRNDDDRTLSEIAQLLAGSGLRTRLNLVRYNSWSDGTGREPDEDRIHRALEMLEPAMRVPGSRIVPRVGFDVAASCGMFLTEAA